MLVGPDVVGVARTGDVDRIGVVSASDACSGAANPFPKPKVEVSGTVPVGTAVAVMESVGVMEVVGVTGAAGGNTSFTSTPASGLPVEPSVTRPLTVLGRSFTSSWLTTPVSISSP